MKICFLILAHSNPEQLSVLLEDIDNDNADIYIHIDKKSDISSFIHLENKNITFIDERVEIYWGEFSIVEATINLLKVATKKKHDYYSLLSGSDILVQSPSKLIKYLELNRGNEFINIIPMPSTKLNKPLSRIEYYTFTQSNIKKILKSSRVSKTITKIANKLFKNKIKRNYKKKIAIETFYAGSQWWTLSSNAVTLILNYCAENPNFIRYFRNVRIPDEVFFQTILGNSHLSKTLIPSLTYTIWKGGKSAHPKELEQKDINNLKKNNYIFETPYGESKAFIARKFANPKISRLIISERGQFK